MADWPVAGEPEYELARALWMVEAEATAKSFDRLPNFNKQAKIAKAVLIMAALEKATDYMVMHKLDIDGG